MKNKALLIGINKYVSLPNNCLNGCVNDVLNIRDILIKYYGFSTSDIRVLLDDRATKPNIMERIKWLTSDVTTGDKIVFHYSGHGSQVRDRDGDELADGMDEILCPTDITFDNCNTFITDDELREEFSKVPAGVVFEVLLDCCHSGTGTRELQALELLPDELKYKPRYVEPPLDIKLRSEGEDIPVNSFVKNGTVKLLNGEASPMTHTLFAGCRSNQTSADAFIGSAYNGAFTYYLCKSIRESQGSIDRLDLLKRLNAFLSNNGFSQVAQIEGKKELKLRKFLNS